MDHFNATIKDGKLVNTRRGLQVSRQKFNGTSFVNASAQDSASSSTQSFRLAKESSSKTVSLPEIKFADNGNDSQTSRIPTNIEQRQGKTPNLSFVAETGQQQTRKPRRRAAPKGQPQHHRRTSTSPYLSSPDSRPSSRSSAVTPSPRTEEATFQFLASPFPVSQQRPQQQQGFPSPVVQHHHYHHQQHLQVNNLTGIPSQPLPPSWPPNELSTVPTSSYLSAFSPSQSDWKLFHYYNTHYLPLQLYPYEDILTYNPARSSSEESSIAESDIAAFHCVLMCGAITEAVINGPHHLSSEPGAEARGFAYHISKICAILNKRLDGSEGGGVDASTLHCIAMLAWMGCYVGRPDHWNMHMRGLQKVLDVLGGPGQAANLPTWVVRRMHSADLKGAAALASPPYLPLTISSLPSPTSTVLPPSILAQTSHTIHSTFQPLGIHPSVISTLTSLANFTSAIQLARQQSSDTRSSIIKFDPYSFTEELQSITYNLLTLPSPLRRRVDVRDGGSDLTLPVLPIGEEHFAAAETLSSALRVASLLFLKELLPDYPRNLGAYAVVLLSLLRQHIASNGKLGSAGEGHIDDDNSDEMLLDPRLRLRRSCPSDSQREGGTQELQRRVIVFLCLVGDIATQKAKENDLRCRDHDDGNAGFSDERQEEDPREEEEEVFWDCLRSVFGASPDREITISEKDLELVRLFDLRGLMGEGWDEREAIGRLLLLGV